MKIIVTHTSPDWDGITSVWLIKKFLPGWEEAKLEFVPAGERLQRLVSQRSASSSKEKKLNVRGYTLDAIEIIGGDEVIHVDTGLGPLDHHQIADTKVSAASLTFDFVKRTNNLQLTTHNSERMKDRVEAIDRMVKIVVDVDHFREVFWQDPTADYHEFSLLGLLDGLKFAKPDQDEYYVDFGIECLEAVLHELENRIWAEREIKNGIKFKIGNGIMKGPPSLKAPARQGIAFETLNDTVLKLAQKMGYDLVVRKDPRKGYLRIKARPCQDGECKIDLTPAFEKLKKLDPQATWFLHVSRHMLLNGTPKNPKMKATKLSLEEIVEVLKNL